MLFYFLVACTSATDSACDSYPTWENWGEGFFLTWCSSCHSQTAPERYGAPESVTFDTTEDIIEWKSRIEYRVIQEQTMPIGGGISQDELQTLQIFLDTLYDCEEL
jgi:uncharacterized membrane protein